MTNSSVQQRHRDISSFLVEHPTIGINEPKKIADGTGYKYKDVENSIVFLKKKNKEDYSQYHIHGLRDKATIHKKKLESYLIISEKIIFNVSTEDDMKLKSIDQATKLRHEIHGIEQNSIGGLTEEINDKNELGK